MPLQLSEKVNFQKSQKNLKFRGVKSCKSWKSELLIKYSIPKMSISEKDEKVHHIPWLHYLYLALSLIFCAKVCTFMIITFLLQKTANFKWVGLGLVEKPIFVRWHLITKLAKGLINFVFKLTKLFVILRNGHRHCSISKKYYSTRAVNETVFYWYDYI